MNKTSRKSNIHGTITHKLYICDNGYLTRIQLP